jgi:hypothetical protein
MRCKCTGDQRRDRTGRHAGRGARFKAFGAKLGVGLGMSLGVNLGAGLPLRLAGQTPAAALQGLPAPLVAAGLSAPNHPIEWARYTHNDECTGVFARATSAAVYDSLDRTPAIDRYRMFDTTPENPWRPLPRGVATATQQCLARFPLAAPPFELHDLLGLAITIQAEPLIAPLVAQWLATGHGTSTVTAAILDTVVGLLMDSPGVPGQPMPAAPSPMHFALARRYAAQLDPLGLIALPMRISAEGALARPGEYTANLDSILTHIQASARLERQLSPSQWQAVEGGISRDTMELIWLGWDARIRWLKTGAPAALARFVELAKATQHLPLTHLGLLGTAAPPITGDYCFATPSTRVPTAGLTPALPARGTPTLVVFDDDDWVEDWSLFALLRRLHQEFPTLQIVQVLHLQGSYQNRWLAQAPAEEARLRREVLADSLGVPGSLCFIQQHYQPLPNGEVVPLVSSLARAYDLDVEDSGWFLLDPSGAFVDVLGSMKGGNTWRTLLQRWTAR